MVLMLLILVLVLGYVATGDLTFVHAIIGALIFTAALAVGILVWIWRQL